MTKLWEKPPFSYTVKENVGGGTGLSGSKSFSTWVALSQRGKRRTRPHDGRIFRFPLRSRRSGAGQAAV